VDGIQNVQPAVAGLRPRVLVIRDQPQLQGLRKAPATAAKVFLPGPQRNYVPLTPSS